MTEEIEVQNGDLHPDLPLSHSTSLSLSFITYQMKKVLISALSISHWPEGTAGWETGTVVKNAGFKIQLTWIRILSSAISGNMVSGI